MYRGHIGKDFCHGPALEKLFQGGHTMHQSQYVMDGWNSVFIELYIRCCKLDIRQKWSCYTHFAWHLQMRLPNGHLLSTKLSPWLIPWSRKSPAWHPCNWATDKWWGKLQEKVKEHCHLVIWKFSKLNGMEISWNQNVCQSIVHEFTCIARHFVMVLCHLVI